MTLIEHRQQMKEDNSICHSLIEIDHVITKTTFSHDKCNFDIFNKFLELFFITIIINIVAFSLLLPISVIYNFITFNILY